MTRFPIRFAPVFLLLTVPLAGCPSEFDPGFSCLADTDCATGLTCSSGVCRSGSVAPDTVFVLPDSSGEETGVSAILNDADGQSVARIETTHEIGGNACPQVLGMFVVTNEASSSVTASLNVAGEGLPIVVSPPSVEVPARGAGSIQIEFDCSATDNVSTSLELSLDLDGRVGVFQVPLALTVIDPGADTVDVVLQDVSGTTVTELSVVHGFGESPCPQPIGAFEVINGTTGTVSATPTLSDPGAPIGFSAESQAVAAASTSRFDLVFTCESAEDFSTTLQVGLANGDHSLSVDFPVSVDVVGAD